MTLAGLDQRATVAACAPACTMQRPLSCVLGDLTFVLLRSMFMRAVVPLPLVEAVAFSGLFWHLDLKCSAITANFFRIPQISNVYMRAYIRACWYANLMHYLQHTKDKASGSSTVPVIANSTLANQIHTATQHPTFTTVSLPYACACLVKL